MRIIMIGCEYAGKSTLAAEISKWLERSMGSAQHGVYGWHDHFVVPFSEGEGPEVEQEIEQVLAMPPKLLEKYSRYMIQYHYGHGFYLDNHHLLVNWYYADAVYAPLYYGYGGADEYADRQLMARGHDKEVMEMAPDTVLVHLKTSPDVVRERKAANPHPRCVLKDADIEFIVQRFEEEYIRSGIRRRFELDATEASAEELLQEFLLKMEPHNTEKDQLAIWAHERLARAGSGTTE